MSVTSDKSTDISLISRFFRWIAGSDLFYLAGPIDSKKEKNYGADWRRQYSADIETLSEEVGFSLRAFDPSKEEPVLLGHSFEDWGNMKTALRIKQDFATFRKMMSAVIKLDLKRVSQSRLVIIRWENEIPAVGTLHEFFYACYLGIPVVIVLEDRREEMNPWLDCLTAIFDIGIYSSWPVLLADLHDSYRHGQGFAFNMRLRRVSKAISVPFQRLLLSILFSSPKPFRKFQGKRSSKVYDPKFPEEPVKRRIIFLIGPPLYGKPRKLKN